MATQEQKQILQYLLYQPLVSAKEFEKVCLTVFQSSTSFFLSVGVL